MGSEEYDAVVAQLVGKDSLAPPAEACLKLLRLSRELKLANSALVARYGQIVLKKHTGGLSEDEVWLLHEQVAVAALACNALDQAGPLIQAIERKFPGSVRMRRLKGMYFEAKGDFSQAEALYKQILVEQPSNEVALKRQVALELSRGNSQGAMEALRRYLDVYANDAEAWEQLGEMHLEALQYRQALFCYEELLLFVPNSVMHLVRLADILYTLGGNSNLRAARAYYARAVEGSQGTSARALMGIVACTAAITDKPVLVDARSRAQIELPDLTAGALLRLYRRHAPAKEPLARAVLESCMQGR